MILFHLLYKFPFPENTKTNEGDENMSSKTFFRKFQSDLLSLESRRLKAEIDQTRTSMESARNHFEQATDPSLIDCYIYELNAAQLRYQFLLRRFKFLEES